MTPAQYTTLKALAAADPVAQAYATDAGADDQAWADWLNTATTQYLWKTYTPGNVPSDGGGEKQSAGWAAVKKVISRIGTRAEMALATGAGTQAAPSTPDWEGVLSASEASSVRVA